MTYALLQPWFLVLLPLALLPWRGRHRPPVAHPDAALLVAAGSSAASKLRWLPIALRSGAIALVVLSLARPVKADSHTRVRVEGIAIQLVIDRSSSMLAMDFTINGQPTDRLTVLKSVVKDFVSGDGTLGGRPNDMIGAVTFAKNADGICPLTLDHDHLLVGVQQLTFARTAQEDGTAIGDGVALGVERMKDVASRNDTMSEQNADPNAASNAPKVKSRVMLLFTDGENNSGDIDPLAASELAQAYGIKIYAVGVGTRGKAPYPVTDVFGQTFLDKVDVTIDEDLLKRMAETTGGRYFRATDTDSLRSIYAEIDRLERTETESRRYLQYADFAVEPLPIAGFTLPPLLAVALVMAFADLLLASTRFRNLA